MKECKCSFHRGPNPLPIHQFGKNKRMVDGLHYWCKMCCSRYYNEKIYPSRKQRSKETVRLWQANNKDKVNETSRKYRARNKEKRRETTKRWRDKNKPTTRHLANQRRANKVQATPKWADGNRIREIYETCPPNHHVHHIVPLRERNDVCGLHCEDNLIILSASEHKAIHADQTALEESWYSYPPPTR